MLTISPAWTLQALGLFGVLVIGLPAILIWINSAATPDCNFEPSFRFLGCLIFHQKEFAGALIAAWGTILAGWLAWAGVQGQLVAARKEDIRSRLNQLLGEGAAFDRFREIAWKLCRHVVRWDDEAGLRDDPSQFFLGTIKAAAEDVSIYFSQLKKATSVGIGDDVRHHDALKDALFQAAEFRSIAFVLDVAIYVRPDRGYSTFEKDFARRSKLGPAFNKIRESFKALDDAAIKIIERLDQEDSP
jgi:hypothetical protein